MIPLYRPYLAGREKEYVNQCLDSTWISSKGEFIAKFENKFAAYVGAPHATSVCNGTAALHLALAALALGPGDEVIVPSLTYIASVNTIVHTGAAPVFVDSLESSWQVDPDDVRRKISSRTKAVMAVHLYGLPCDMEQLVDICKVHKLYLVEDCAEAFGTYFKEQHVGTFGDIGTFSFFGNKTITTGEGGMVIANNQELLEKAYHLKTQGVSPVREYWHDVVAYNYRMTNICAAIGLAQLENADAILEKKRNIAGWYQEKLKGLPLKTHNEIQGTRHSHWMSSIVVDSAERRQPLRDHLKAAGVETRPLFYPAHILPPYATGSSLPVAESLSARGVNLPSYPDLSQTEVNDVCLAIRQFFEPRKNNARP
jgi:perosamine synthetase